MRSIPGFNFSLNLPSLNPNEKVMMERDQALELLHEYVKNPKMIAHCLASEAVLRAMAERLD